VDLFYLGVFLDRLGQCTVRLLALLHLLRIVRQQCLDGTIQERDSRSELSGRGSVEIEAPNAADLVFLREVGDVGCCWVRVVNNFEEL
jgi:hypothetical protein